MSKPNFVVKIDPGLTLEGSKFSAIGEQLLPGAYTTRYYAAAKAWAEATYGKGVKVGAQSNLTGTKLVVLNDDEKPTLTLTPESLRHSLWDNSGGLVTSHNTTELNDQISTTTTIGWNVSVTAGLSFTVGLTVGGGPVKANASTTYSISATAGHTASHSRTHSVGSSDSVTVDVPPGLVELAILLVETGTLSVDVVFGHVFTGSVYVYTVLPDGTTKTDTVDGAELSKHYKLPEYTANISVGFVGEDVTRTVTIPDASPESVDKAIEEAKKELSMDDTRDGEWVRDPRDKFGITLQGSTIEANGVPVAFTTQEAAGRATDGLIAAFVDDGVSEKNAYALIKIVELT